MNVFFTDFLTSIFIIFCGGFLTPDVADVVNDVVGGFDKDFLTTAAAIYFVAIADYFDWFYVCTKRNCFNVVFL